MCTVRDRFRTPSYASQSFEFGLINPTQTGLNSNVVVLLSQAYQYFRVKSCTVRVIDTLSMTLGAVVTGTFFYDSEAINLVLAAGTSDRQIAIRQNTSTRMFSIHDERAMWAFNPSATSQRKWWRCDTTSNPSPEALEQTTPAMFAAAFEGLSDVGIPLAYLEYDIVWEFKDLFKRLPGDAFRGSAGTDGQSKLVEGGASASEPVAISPSLPPPFDPLVSSRPLGDDGAGGKSFNEDEIREMVSRLSKIYT